MKWTASIFLAVLGSVRSTSSLTNANSLIARTTRKWVEKIVIGKRLCPWAKMVYDEKMKITVLNQFTGQGWASSNSDQVLGLTSEVLKEAQLLAKPQLAGHTTLLVLPNFASSDFELYLDMSSALEELLESEELSNAIQIATFHPLYQFAETQPSDASNYSNRSPYPIIHLLRVNDVSQAIEQYESQKGTKGTDAIWETNIATMESIGYDKLAATLEQIKSEAAAEEREETDNARKPDHCL